MSDLIVGLDIGTSNVRCLIGEVTVNSQTLEKEFQITGVGVAKSTGLRNGTIVNIESTSQAIKKAIEDAELMSGNQVYTVYTQINGCQVVTQDSHGAVAVVQKDPNSNTREISEEDKERVLESATAVPLSVDRTLISHVVQNYTVNETAVVKDPINMIGVRLEASVHLITASSTPLQNIYRCIQRAGFDTAEIQLNTLVAAQAATSKDERDVGSILIDMGGGSTDAIAFWDDAPICTASVNYGGDIITKDIAIVCGISFEAAERIKCLSGCAWEPILENYEPVMIPGVGGDSPKERSRNDICRIIQPRVLEIFSMLREKIIQNLGENARKMKGNIILVGGGAKLPGVMECAQMIFEPPHIHISNFSGINALPTEYRSPEFATALGLVVSNLDKHNKSASIPEIVEEEKGKGFFSSISGWFKELF